MCNLKLKTQRNIVFKPLNKLTCLPRRPHVPSLSSSSCMATLWSLASSGTPPLLLSGLTYAAALLKVLGPARPVRFQLLSSVSVWYYLLSWLIYIVCIFSPARLISATRGRWWINKWMNECHTSSFFPCSVITNYSRKSLLPFPSHLTITCLCEGETSSAHGTIMLWTLICFWCMHLHILCIQLTANRHLLDVNVFYWSIYHCHYTCEPTVYVTSNVKKQLIYAITWGKS